MPDARESAVLPGPKGGYFSGSVTHFRRDHGWASTMRARASTETSSTPGWVLTASSLIYHPDAIEEIFVTRNRTSSRVPACACSVHSLGDGLFSPRATSWLRQRRLLQPVFHRQRVAALRRRDGRVRRAPCRRLEGRRRLRGARGDDGADPGDSRQDPLRRRRLRRCPRGRSSARVLARTSAPGCPASS